MCSCIRNVTTACIHGGDVLLYKWAKRGNVKEWDRERLTNLKSTGLLTNMSNHSYGFMGLTNGKLIVAKFT